MRNFKISTSIVNNVPKMGIIDASTFEQIVPFEYHHIIKIKNHKDLSLNNYEDVYLLFEDDLNHHLDLSQFCFIKNGKAIISKQVYHDYFQCFYQGKTICRLDGKQIIIDLNENILRGPLDEIMEIQDDLMDNFRELVRCIDDDRDFFYYTINKQNDSIAYNLESIWDLEIEQKLGGNFGTSGRYASLQYTYLGEFSEVGLCTFKDGDKFGFLNRYLFEIGNNFDYIFNKKELLQIGIINKDPFIQYVEKDGQILKIQLLGNFVNEITNYPSLFFKNDSVKQYFSNRKVPEDNQFKDQNFFKLDHEILKSADIPYDKLKEVIVECLPFYMHDDFYNKSNIDELVKEHNDLFGLIPSSYIVLEEVQSTITKIQYNLIPFRDGNKYGYKNHFQELIVPCIYAAAEPVINGFGAVELDGKWGLINGNFDVPFDVNYKYGDLIVECIYDNIGDFSEGLFSVIKDGKWGFIDPNGNTIIPIIYNEVKGFSEGFAAVLLDGKAGFIDKKGALLCPLIYDNAHYFNNGFASIFLDGKHGMINRQGKEATMIKYDQPLLFSDGLFLVTLNGKDGFITEEWDWAVENVYDWAYPFSEGLARVGLNSKYGYVDKYGNVIIPIEFTEAYDFKSGVARVLKDGKFGYIDKKGETIIPFIFDKAEDFVDGFATVKLKEFYGIINSKGGVVIPFSYEFIDPKCFSDGLVAVRKFTLDGEYKFGYLDQSGNMVISGNYSMTSTFLDGIALVAEDNSLDQSEIFIDTDGNEYWRK